MTPQEFAEMLRRVQDLHESSWDGRRYTLRLDECCDEHCPEPWAGIVRCTLTAGYADVWDWCDKVAPRD